jgi:Hypoxia induced protein conserved region
MVESEKEGLMSIINVLIIGALIATVVVLGLGLRSMARGGSYDKEHAEKFMWERVALQLLVVILLLAAAFVLNT